MTTVSELNKKATSNEEFERSIFAALRAMQPPVMQVYQCRMCGRL